MTILTGKPTIKATSTPNAAITTVAIAAIAPTDRLPPPSPHERIVKNNLNLITLLINYLLLYLAAVLWGCYELMLLPLAQ